MWKWRPSRDTLAAIRFVALLLVMTFGFLTPLMFFVVYMFDRFGMDVAIPKGWIELVSGMISLVTAVIAATVGEKRSEPRR